MCCPPLAAPAATPQPSAANGAPAKSRQAFKFVSVTSVFKRQLADLMSQLGAMEPHYVRCIKPNPASTPLVLDAPYVLQQLTCGGVMEAVRISAAGEQDAAGLGLQVPGVEMSHGYSHAGSAAATPCSPVGHQGQLVPVL